MWEMEDTMNANSGQRHLQDSTTVNNASMHWLEHVTRLSTDALSALGANQLISRHPLHRDGIMFHVIVNIIQLATKNNEPLFQVDYDKNDFSSNGGAVNE